MSQKVIEPAEFRACMRQMEGTDDHETYQRLVDFCNKHRQYSDPPLIEIPASWSGVVLNCLGRMIAREPSVKIRRISNEDGKLRIYNSYVARNKDELEQIKINTYNAIDRLILKKIDALMGNKIGYIL